MRTFLAVAISLSVGVAAGAQPATACAQRGTPGKAQNAQDRPKQRSANPR